MKTKTLSSGIVVNEITTLIDEVCFNIPIGQSYSDHYEISKWVDDIDFLKAKGVTHICIGAPHYNGDIDSISLLGYTSRWETEEEAIERNINAEKVQERRDRKKFLSFMTPEILTKLSEDYPNHTVSELLEELKKI